MMCIGIPMQIVSYEGSYAWCRPYHRDKGQAAELKRINMQLLGELPPGSWVLTFLDSAREELSEIAAMQIQQAIQAVELVMQGEALGNQRLQELFADLIEREPQLPPHLQRSQN